MKARSIGVRRLKIRQRIRTDDSIIDICEYDEFSSLYTGLGLTWMCSQLKDFFVSGCTVAVKDKKTFETLSLPTVLEGNTAAPFIGQWLDKRPDTIIVEGVYSKMPISITFNFIYKNVSFGYPKDKNGQVEPLEKQFEEAAKDYFTVLKHQKSYELGGKSVSEYSCKLLTSASACLAAIGACMQTQGAILRWVTLFPEGKAPTDSDYYALTLKSKRPIGQLIREYRKQQITGARAVLSINQKYVSVYVDNATQTVTIAIDKWLTPSLTQIVSQFNMNIFEAFFVSCSSLVEEGIRA